MKPRGKVSSIQGANTVFEGQQINTQTHREKRQRRHRRERREEETHTQRREITEQITAERPKTPDQGRSKQQIQRETRTAPRHNVRVFEYIVNRYCSDD
jgi:hypothetical protein